MENTFLISNFINQLSEKCPKIYRKSIKKGDFLTTYIEKRQQICIMITGEAELIRYDFNGNKSILSNYNDNEIFGEVFYPVTTNNELFVIAKKNCEVLFMDYENLQNKCKDNCPFHELLRNNLSQLLCNKIITLNTRIELLTKRGTREKLLSYFNILSNKKLSKIFLIPFSFTDLADYLSVDRSAMMRELKSLKEDGFILKNGNKITLLY